jgi:hypothetical protein
MWDRIHTRDARAIAQAAGGDFPSRVRWVEVITSNPVKIALATDIKYSQPCSLINCYTLHKRNHSVNIM